jgi:hypothetical protein
MEGRTRLVCADCGRTCELPARCRELSGNVYALRHDAGLSAAANATLALICGACLAKYVGHETRDDAAKCTSS